MSGNLQIMSEEAIMRLRKMAEDMKPAGEKVGKRLQESEKRVEKLLAENAMMRRKLQTGYHFSKDEMIEHDKAVAKEARKIAEQSFVKAQLDAMDEKYEEQVKQYKTVTEEFWEECKRDFKKGDPEESFLEWCRVMWAIPIETLVEDFHWKPITEDCCCDNRQNLVKFCRRCDERAGKIVSDQLIDIRTYCKQVADKYGAGFVTEE